MKHFTKGAEPVALAEWKNRETDDWKPTFDKLSGDEKKAVLTALKIEQGYICCYCERTLQDDDCHIEHHNPQDLEQIDPLEYSNMICSCQKALKKGDPRHCGNSKGKWFDEILFISPLNPHCESRFIYYHNGRIAPAVSTDLAAITTINKLQLGIDKLNALRKAAIDAFIEEEISAEDVTDFAASYLVEKEHNGGKFNMFYTTIKSLFS